MSVAKRLIEEQIEQNAKEAELEEAAFERVEKFFNERSNQPKREWVGFTHEELAWLNEALNLGGRLAVIEAIEAKLKEKNT